MATSARSKTSARMTLEAGYAADLMKDNPVSIRENATIQETAALLTDKGFSAAPVIQPRSPVPPCRMQQALRA